MKSSNQQSCSAEPAITSDSTQNGNDVLPPEKQLLKLKRFLKTIYQFSKDLPPAQREKVKELIVNVIVSEFYYRRKYVCQFRINIFQKQQISEQVFYTELQGSTKFPLRPYVVPFLQVSKLIEIHSKIL